MPDQDYRKNSRLNWICTNPQTMKENSYISLGCQLRIADSLEGIAKSTNDFAHIALRRAELEVENKQLRNQVRQLKRQLKAASETEKATTSGPKFPFKNDQQ